LDPAQKQYYPFLDGFRALAIIWVLVHHLNYFFHPAPLFLDPVAGILNRFAYLGRLGVDIFFVISGFLISGLLFEDLPGKIRIRRFYLRRAFKIVPQYISVVVVGFILTILFEPTQPHLLFSMASYLFLFQNYVQSNGYLAHLWSIAVEEHFYFLYPLFLQAIVVLVRSVERQRRVLLAAFFVMMGLIFFIRRATFVAFPYNPLMLFQMSHLRFDALLCGCVIKLLEGFLTGPFVARLKLFPLACFLASGGLFYKVFLHFDACRSSSYVCVYLASGLLLVSALCGFGPLLALTQNRLVRSIGRHSYGTYIWHYPLMLTVRHLVNRTDWFIILSTFLLSLGAGYLSTVTIEKYFLNLRKKVVP